MPVIPKRDLVGIDGRVQDININTQGVGVVAKALGGIGAEGAQFANELLQRRKNAEATTYARESQRAKQIGAQRKAKELALDMNPLTGRIKSTGRTYFEEMQQWENDALLELEKNAPTEQARDTFRSLELPAITGRLAEADSFQTKTIWNAQIQEDKDVAENNSKQLLSHDNKSGTSVYKLGNTLLSDYEKQIASKIGAYYTESEANKLLSDFANSIAKAGTESMLQQEALPDFFKANGLTRMVPKQMETFSKILEENAIIPKGGEVVFNDKGEPLLIGEKEGKDKVNFKNLVTGEKGIADLAFAKKQKVDLPPIGISGDAGENLFYKHLTEEDITRNMWRGAQALKDSQESNNRALLGEGRDWSTALESDGPNKLRLSNPKTAQEFGNFFNRVVSSSLDEFSKDELIRNLMASKALGEFSDSAKLGNLVKSQQLIKNLPNKIKSDIVASGRGGKYNTPEFAAAVTEKAMVEAAAKLSDISQKINKNMPSYLAQVDPQFNRLNENKFKSSKDFKAYTDHITKRNNQMGLNPVNEKFFTENDLALDALQIKRRLDNGAKDKYSGALSWMMARKEVLGDHYFQYVDEIANFGIPKEISFISTFQNNVVGDATAQRALENLVEHKERVKQLPESILEKIKIGVYNKVYEHLAGIRQNASPGVKEKTVNAFLNMGIMEATRRIVAEGQDISDASADSSLQIFDKNFYTYRDGPTVMTMSIMEKDAYGLNDSILRAADTYFRSKEFLEDNIDVEGTFEKLTPILNNYFNADKSDQYKKIYGVKDRNGLAVKLLKQGLGGLKGDILLIKNGDKAVPVFKREDTREEIGLKTKEGKPFSIPLRELKNNKNVIEIQNTLFGNDFRLDRPLFKGNNAATFF